VEESQEGIRMMSQLFSTKNGIFPLPFPENVTFAKGERWMCLVQVPYHVQEVEKR
jgi:hypothetical protein